MSQQLTEQDLKELAENPEEFLRSPANRAKALGMPEAELKKKLSEYANRNNITTAGLIKEIITEIDPHLA